MVGCGATMLDCHSSMDNRLSDMPSSPFDFGAPLICVQPLRKNNRLHINRTDFCYH